MKKIMIIAACSAILGGCAFIFAGCQTRITAEKHAENALPIQEVVTVNGTNMLVTTHYQISSGGWEATARSPLWAKEDLKGLNIEVATNGTVRLAVDDYHRDLSTNAVIVTDTLVKGAVTLTEKVAAAIVTSGGSTAASGTQAAISSLVAKYLSEGGNADNATITCKDGSCTISDGTTTCSDGSCYPSN